MDLTQTSYSKVPSIDIELGNAASDHSQEKLDALAFSADELEILKSLLIRVARNLSEETEEKEC